MVKKKKKNYEKKSIGIGQKVEIEDLIIFIVFQYIKIYDQGLNLPFFLPFFSKQLFIFVNFLSYEKKRKEKEKKKLLSSWNVHRSNIIDILF